MQYNIQSTLQEVQDFEVKLDEMLNGLKLNKQTMFHIRLAFHEAIINVIQHTYNFSTDKKITIDINITKEVFECFIYDYGEKVSPDKIKPHKKDEIQTSGLGVFLYSKLMDEVEFSNTSEGNLIKLLKFFKPTDFIS